jgi:hypothetical protein
MWDLGNKDWGRHTHICGRKNKLIARYSCDNGAVFRVEVHVAHQEFVPFGCCGAEDCCRALG